MSELQKRSQQPIKTHTSPKRVYFSTENDSSQPRDLYDTHDPLKVQQKSVLKSSSTTFTTRNAIPEKTSATASDDESANTNAQQPLEFDHPLADSDSAVPVGSVQKSAISADEAILKDPIINNTIMSRQRKTRTDTTALRNNQNRRVLRSHTKNEGANKDGANLGFFLQCNLSCNEAWTCHGTGYLRVLPNKRAAEKRKLVENKAEDDRSPVEKLSLIHI